MTVTMKVANKMLVKAAGRDETFANVSDRDNTLLKVESIAIYGGVDIQPQMRSLGLSCDGSEINEPHQRKSLVIAATPGRLLDIMKQLREIEQTKSVPPVFGDVRTIIFDEADRMALNAEMACQIDEILSTLKVQNKSEIVTCLVSATLPHKTKEIIDRWVPYRRVVIKVDSVQVGEKQQVKFRDNNLDDSCPRGNEKAECGEEADKPVKSKLPTNLDLATIPSNLVQTLHVCAAHKKPKKLILTLQRIYKNPKKSQGQRPENNNRLCIVFFAQIKTLKFISKILFKEGEHFPAPCLLVCFVLSLKQSFLFTTIPRARVEMC
jgi:superfamily II DNA/RNA helicase